jgi:glycosyltransferase involved in cell wall biosynthesis
MSKFSVYLITKNEAAHLTEVLASCQGADEIVVVDSGSTDATCEIAKKAGAKIINQPWLGFAAQKNFALEHCSHPWVLHLDGDEILSENAVSLIKSAIDSSTINGYYIKRDDFFMGESMGYSHCRPFLRLYRKKGAHWDEKKLVHEAVNVPKPHAHLAGVSLKHWGYNTVSGYMDKLNKYSVLKSQMRHRDDRGYSWIRLVSAFPLGFIKHYFLRRMIFSGSRGLVRAMQDAFSMFLTEAMLLELKRAESKPKSPTDESTKR